MIEELQALAGSQRMGRVLWDRRRDRLSFVYEAEWQEATSSFPLSLSMPLTAAEHPQHVIDPFLWGLLPDNDSVLQRWGERFHVSPRHAFQLLQHVGEECAGGVQFARPERASQWIEGKDKGSVTWLSESEIAERIQLLLKDHSVSRIATDAGQFSLAGAQPKTAFLYDPKANRWGVPSGTIPTTHIFKPATGAFDGYAENEHFCISLARSLNMPVVSSAIHHYNGAPVIVVQRYDRQRLGERVTRIHQEDMCQALARMPHLKYQNQGGPSPSEIVALVREHSTRQREDEHRFIDALIFSWLIAGTDAHAKNYSFLIAPQGQVRLAPLYDLSSALPYPLRIARRDTTLAMKIGNHYKLLSIGRREWTKCAALLGVSADLLYVRILELASTLPDAARKVGQEMQAMGITHNVVGRLIEALDKRASSCQSAIQS